MPASAAPPSLDPLDPAFAADPRPEYHRLRTHGPISWSEQKQAWIVTGHPEYLAVVRDQRLSMNIRHWEHFEGPTDAAAQRLRRIDEHSMSMLPLAKHDRIRKIVSSAFTPRATARLVPLVTRTVEELADASIAIFSPLLSGEHRRRAQVSQEELVKLIELVILEHEGVERGDILSTLLEAEAGGERLTRDELIALVYVLILGGTETTTNSVVLGTLEMLRNPDQLALFRSRPELRPAAVMELLRVQFPGYFLTRYATEDLEIAGVAIRKGQGLLISVQAAHCDPRVFPDPDRLDITRDLKEMQGVFGSGRLFCLGANLARLELSTAYAKIFDSLPDLRLAVPESELRYRKNVAVRSLEALPLLFTAS